MKKLIAFVAICGILFFVSCSEPISTDKGGEPNPPRWVELAVKIDSLPAVGKTGSMQFKFIVTGKGDKLPVAYETGDTMNYIRISFKPDPGRQRFTIMSGDTLWEGKVSFLENITLNTQFKPLKTSNIYFTLDGGYREFDWAVYILIGYYHQKASGELIAPFMGNLDPPFNNPEYAYLYINTKTRDTYIKIKAN